MGSGQPIFVLGALALYFLPTVVAFYKHKAKLGRLFLLNLFLGITIIGWALLLRKQLKDA